MFFSKLYRLNHCRDVLQKTYRQFEKKQGDLRLPDQEELRKQMRAVQSAITSNDRKKADEQTRVLESLRDRLIPTPMAFKWLESALALLVALAFAILIRQSWFELYEIPTGSMRPTFKEQDHLTVSKTQFGINTPLSTSHLLFEPDQVKRTGTIIFSGDGLPLLDTSSTFLGVFPYTKRYVKRLIGKPGDKLTFYGGKIYGLDQNDQPIRELLDAPWMQTLEHIPFLSFEGQPMRGKNQEVLLNYFYIPSGRITMLPDGSLKGEVFNGKNWVADDLSAAKKPHDSVQTLSDLFGMRNFAMTQLYTKEEIALDPDLKNLKLDIAPYYLVFRHTPHLDFQRSKSRQFPLTLKSAIPLTNDDLLTLQGNLYTARFVVENERARRYSLDGNSASSIILANVPDGTYEFYHGIAHEVLFGGITKELPRDHALYAPALIPTLYNLGIQWDRSALPMGKQLSTRFAYFREGALYVMGSPLLAKDSPQVKTFIQKEKEREEKEMGYVAFVDQGAPALTASGLKSFGITIPAFHYMVLGDNHAMSGDSRVFGFVSESNLQGVPEFIFWPPGDRMGSPSQPEYPTFVTPRLIIWGVAAIGGICFYLLRRRRLRKPLPL